MHGNGRTAKRYRDVWIKYAEKYRFLLLAPEFSKKNYPSIREYHRGNVLSKTGKPIAEKYWTFTAIENIFDYVQTISVVKAKTYKIYGHSAGGQFVHRFVLIKPDARFEVAIAANAGVYTMPTDEYAFPLGLKNVDVSGETLKKAFKKKLIVLLGDKDTDENHKDLPKTSGAMAQGKHRFARGIRFFGVAKEKAKKFETPFRWQLKRAKNANHSNTQMAKTASKLLF
jgi:pimeloyl-ACP methyl ester carboxylesterase